MKDENLNEQAIYAMLHDFRNWNRDWDLLMSKNPQSVDEFVKELSKKYQVKPIK